MAKGKALSDFEKGQIQEFFDSGISKEKLLDVWVEVCALCATFYPKLMLMAKPKVYFAA